MAGSAQEPLRGHLWKRSPSKLKLYRYQWRFMYLEGGMMYWWRNADKCRAKGVDGCCGSVDLQLNHCKVHRDVKHPYRFTLVPGRGQWHQGQFTGGDASRVFEFDAAESEFSRETWMRALECHAEPRGASLCVELVSLKPQMPLTFKPCDRVRSEELATPTADIPSTAVETQFAASAQTSVPDAVATTVKASDAAETNDPVTAEIDVPTDVAKSHAVLEGKTDAMNPESSCAAVSAETSTDAGDRGAQNTEDADKPGMSSDALGPEDEIDTSIATIKPDMSSDAVGPEYQTSNEAGTSELSIDAANVQTSADLFQSDTSARNDSAVQDKRLSDSDLSVSGETQTLEDRPAAAPADQNSTRQIQRKSVCWAPDNDVKEVSDDEEDGDGPITFCMQNSEITNTDKRSSLEERYDALEIMAKAAADNLLPSAELDLTAGTEVYELYDDELSSDDGGGGLEACEVVEEVVEDDEPALVTRRHGKKSTLARHYDALDCAEALGTVAANETESFSESGNTLSTTKSEVLRARRPSRGFASPQSALQGWEGVRERANSEEPLSSAQVGSQMELEH